MTWVAWRQQRAEVVLGAVVLAVLAALFIPTGLHMSGAYETDGAAACVRAPAGGCAQLLDAFDARFSTIIGVTGWFALLPVVIAVIFAAPFALELERGTYRLAWTQSITRRRWLAASSRSRSAVPRSLGRAPRCCSPGGAGRWTTSTAASSPVRSSSRASLRSRTPCSPPH